MTAPTFVAWAARLGRLRLDGTLLSCNLVTMHAYYARNDRSIVKSVYQLTKVILSVPLLITGEVSVAP